MLTDPGGLGELEVIYGSQAHPSQETVSSWQTGFLPEGGFTQQSLSVGLSPAVDSSVDGEDAASPPPSPPPFISS